MDLLNSQITNSIIKASKLHIFPHIYKPYKKPYWNDDVKEAHKQARNKRKKWISEGRPRGNIHE